MLVENLARAIDKDILDDEEIIVTGEHECEQQPRIEPVTNTQFLASSKRGTMEEAR